MKVSFTIHGKLVSAKNRKIQTKSGFVFKNPEVVRYERDFRSQVPSEFRGLQLGSRTEPLSATVTVFYPSRRSDLDCALVYDLLQHTGVIANDRYITRKLEEARVDKENPRVAIEIDEPETCSCPCHCLNLGYMADGKCRDCAEGRHRVEVR